MKPKLHNIRGFRWGPLQDFDVIMFDWTLTDWYAEELYELLGL